MVCELIHKNKKPDLLSQTRSKSRSGGIRTRGLLVPNQTRYQTALHLDKNGANNGTRTHDLLITNQPLYQLSYIGKPNANYYNKTLGFCLEEISYFALFFCVILFSNAFPEKCYHHVLLSLTARGA